MSDTIVRDPLMAEHERTATPLGAFPLLYECPAVIRQIVDALRPLLRRGDMIIWRAPFRWYSDAGVLSNHYESFSADELCESHGYTLVLDLTDIAIVRREASNG